MKTTRCMYPFKSFDDAVRYHQEEGWRVGRAHCLSCGRKWNAIIHPQHSEVEIDCVRCGRRHSNFTELPLVNRKS